MKAKRSCRWANHARPQPALYIRSGKAYPVLQDQAPFYKAVALAIGASTVALLRPGSDQGGGPYGLEVWRLTYQARPQ